MSQLTPVSMKRVHPGTCGSNTASALSVCVQDAIELRDAGFFKGANTANVMIAEGDSWYDEDLIRLDNEAAASRLVGLLVSCCGAPSLPSLMQGWPCGPLHPASPIAQGLAG